MPQTVNDVHALQDALVRDAGYQVRPPLVGSDAHRAGIEAALDQLATVSTSATVLFYYSGHGEVRHDGTRDHYYLLPHGYDPARHDDTCLPSQEVTERLLRIPARLLIAFFDCCHAAGQFKGSAGAKRVSAPDDLVAALGHGGRFVMSSSQSSEKSYVGDRLSVFTECLIAGLRGGNGACLDRRTGAVTLLRLAEYLVREVPQRARELRAPGPQTPVLRNASNLGCEPIARPRPP